MTLSGAVKVSVSDQDPLTATAGGVSRQVMSSSDVESCGSSASSRRQRRAGAQAGAATPGSRAAAGRGGGAEGGPAEVGPAEGGSGGDAITKPAGCEPSAQLPTGLARHSTPGARGLARAGGDRGEHRSLPSCHCRSKPPLPHTPQHCLLGTAPSSGPGWADLPLCGDLRESLKHLVTPVLTLHSVWNEGL